MLNVRGQLTSATAINGFSDMGELNNQAWEGMLPVSYEIYACSGQVNATTFRVRMTILYTLYVHWQVLTDLVTGFFFCLCFWRTSGSLFIIFSSVAPHKGQPAAKCHPRWQPTGRWAVSCGLGRRWIQTQDCRTTVRRATTEPPCLPN